MGTPEKAIVAMRLVVLWREMYYFCMTRNGNCSECPYNEKGICTKATTEQVLRYSADAFNDFFDLVDTIS